MNKQFFLLGIVIVATALAPLSAAGQASEPTLSTPPPTAAELETIYNSNIEKRTADILRLLALNNETKSTRVHDLIIAQYRSLRARDEAVDNMLKELSKNAPGEEANRPLIIPILSKTLHDQFIAKLSAELTPDQVDLVKDKMTYDKVKVTYAAYCEILPDLNDSDKAMILDGLKAAREEAMDGGSAREKTAVFQNHKDKINAELSAKGHDFAKASAEWEAKQEQIAKAKSEAEDKSAAGHN